MFNKIEIHRLLTLRMKRGYTRDLRRYQKNNKKYYEQLFTYKFDNLDKMGQLLQKHKLVQLTQYKIIWIA